MQDKAKCYAGIGSRETPPDIQDKMTETALLLQTYNYILRSGGAPGADSSFELGAGELKDIFLPWTGFEGRYGKHYTSEPSSEAFVIAEKYHPSWKHLSDGAKRLIARNGHQVLGFDLKSLADFILCYTKNGAGEGGTGQAIRIAIDKNIPIFDFGKNYSDIDLALKNFLQLFGI